MIKNNYKNFNSKHIYKQLIKNFFNKSDIVIDKTMVVEKKDILR